MLIENQLAKGLVQQPNHAQSQHIKLPMIQQKMFNYQQQFQSQEGLFTASKQSLLQKYKNTKYDLQKMKRCHESGRTHSRNAVLSLD